jgi:hypothetical protein
VYIYLLSTPKFMILLPVHHTPFFNTPTYLTVFKMKFTKALTSASAILLANASPINLNNTRRLNTTASLVIPPYDSSIAVPLYGTDLTDPDMHFPSELVTLYSMTENSPTLHRPFNSKPWTNPDWFDPYGPVSKGYFSIVVVLNGNPEPEKYHDEMLPYAALYGQNVKPRVYVMKCAYYSHGPRARWNDLYSWLPFTINIHTSREWCYPDNGDDNLWIRYADQHLNVSTHVLCSLRETWRGR